MAYQSLEFFAFAAAVVLLYYALGKKMQKWVLLAANIVWGMYFAVVMMLSNICVGINAKIPAKLGWNTDCFSWRLFQMTRTFVICCIGRVMPRAKDIGAAIEIYKRTWQNATPQVFFDGSLYKYGLDQTNMTIVLFAIALLWCIDLLQEKIHIRETLAEQNLPFRWAVGIGAVLLILIFGIYGPGYDVTALIYGRY